MISRILSREYSPFVENIGLQMPKIAYFGLQMLETNMCFSSSKFTCWNNFKENNVLKYGESKILVRYFHSFTFMLNELEGALNKSCLIVGN